MNEMFDWYVGIDWASEVHQVCLVDDRGVVRGERTVRHSGEELAALAAWLIEPRAPLRSASPLASNCPTARWWRA